MGLISIFGRSNQTIIKYMSFKIFSLQLLGKLKPVEKIEQQRAALESDYQEFLRVEKSDELAEFLKLETFINSAEFKKQKTEIEALRFKGSKESKQLADLEKLKKSKKIKKYFVVEGSADLKRFESLKNSVKQKEFEELLELKKVGQLQKNSKKFGKEEALNKLQRYKALATDSDIRFFIKYGKSGLYKNYLDVKDSSDLKRFNELKELVESKDFSERKAYLEDKDKWKKSDAYAQEKMYLEMKSKPHLVNYFKYKDSSHFDFFRKWEVAFADDFSASALQKEKWSVCNYHAEKMLGGNYSLPGDLQVFTNGNNIKVSEKLVIETRKEKLTGNMWKMPAGFIPTEFDYSSGLISSGNSFWMEDGIVEAKIRFQPVKQLVSSFYLSGEKNTPRVNLLEMGVKNWLGFTSLDTNGKAKWEGLDISNLKSGQSYIFTLEKSGASFTWKINETEVLTLNKADMNISLHLNASSLVVYDVPDSNLSVRFEIGWIKCYRKK